MKPAITTSRSPDGPKAGAEKLEQEERIAVFEDEALARLAKLGQTGEAIAWSDMKRYLEARAEGKSAQPLGVNAE